MYGSECWTLRKKEKKKIEAFEMWTWRRLLRIAWTAKKTNAWVLDQIRCERSLLNVIEKNRLKYCGHIVRSDDSLEKAIMLGTTTGTWRRGRPKERWLDNTRGATGLTLHGALTLARDRVKWRRLC